MEGKKNPLKPLHLAVLARSHKIAARERQKEKCAD
jgi:hypothetical protein